MGLLCELCLMLEVATSLHLHVKSAVTADCCNLMIGLLLHNDLITASLCAALDAAASLVSRFPRIDRLHFDVV